MGVANIFKTYFPPIAYVCLSEKIRSFFFWYIILWLNFFFIYEIYLTPRICIIRIWKSMFQVFSQDYQYIIISFVLIMEQYFFFMCKCALNNMWSLQIYAFVLIHKSGHSTMFSSNYCHLLNLIFSIHWQTPY